MQLCSNHGALPRVMQLITAPAQPGCRHQTQSHRANGWAGLAVRFHSCSLRQGSLFRFLPCLRLARLHNNQ